MKNFAAFHLGESPRILSAQIPGKESRRLLEQQKQIEGSVVSYPRSIPIAIKKAKGAIIEDVDGNRFLDFFAGAGVLNVGHTNPEVLEYVEKQQQELIHALDFPTQNKMDAITKILAHLPEHLRDEYKVSFGGPTGSDAVEAAVKLAKMKTGRETIIAFAGGYHGMSAGALALTSDVNYRRRLFSLLPNVHFAPYPYCYRCPFGKQKENCSLDCFSYLKNLIENSHSGIPLPAAILIEPIQGEGGSIPALAVYLERLIDLANEHGIVVILDEIQSGFFRSGKFLSFMHTKAIPHIITISKGLGGIGFPLSGLIYRKDVEAWGPGDHIGTFRGNQVSLAAANGAFDFVDKYELAEHAAQMGEYLVGRLRELRSPFIGEIRGQGLMIGMEIVRNKETKVPYPELVKKLKQECLQRGLLFEVGGHHGNVVRFIPPLIITLKIVDYAIAILQLAFQALAKGRRLAKDQGTMTLNKIDIP